MDRHGVFWIGGTRGVFRKDGDVWIETPVTADTWAIEEDEEGRIWVAGNQVGYLEVTRDPVSEGVVRTSFHSLLERSGSGEGAGATYTAFFRDRDGGIWLGSRGRGLGLVRREASSIFLSRRRRTPEK